MLPPNASPERILRVALVLALVACGKDDTVALSVSEGAVTIADSIVLSDTGDLESVPQHLLRRADVVIGGWRQDAVTIPNVRGAAMLPDGTVWVAASMTSQVLTFTPDGRPLGVLGREGEGPGEFSRGPWGVYACRDAVLVDEQWRYTFFSFDGILQRVVPVPPGALAGGPALTVGVSPDCSAVLLRVGNVPSPRRGAFRGQDILAWLDLTTGTLDTVAAVGGMERSGQEVGGRLEPMPTPFGSGGVWAQAGDAVYVGLSSDPIVTLFDRSGRPARTVRWQAPRRPVSRTELDALETNRAAQLDRNPSLAPLLPSVNSYPIPSTAPVFVSALASDDRSLWIREFPPASDGFGLPLGGVSSDPSRILVFGPDGKLREIVLVPPEMTIHQVRGRRVLTSRLDEMGFPTVEIYVVPIH